MDDELIERLLSGDPTASAEAPELSTLLAAASAPVSESGPLAGESAALAAFRATHAAGPSRRKRMIPQFVTGKALGALAAGALALTGGVGVAAAADATGIAHNPVGSTVTDVVTGSHGHGNANGHAKTQDSSQPTTDVPNNQDNQGSKVSDAAQNDCEQTPAATTWTYKGTGASHEAFDTRGQCVSYAVHQVNGGGQDQVTNDSSPGKSGDAQDKGSNAKANHGQSGDHPTAPSTESSTSGDDSESTEPKDATTESTEQQQDQQEVAPQGAPTTGSGESTQHSHAKSSH